MIIYALPHLIVHSGPDCHSDAVGRHPPGAVRPTGARAVARELDPPGHTAHFHVERTPVLDLGPHGAVESSQSSFFLHGKALSALQWRLRQLAKVLGAIQ